MIKFLKYLIIGIIFSILPSCVSAKDQTVTWNKGDTVTTFYICKTQEDIMEIAMADTKGEYFLRQKVLIKTMESACLGLNPPLGFTVSEILGSYSDANKKETSILGVSLPNRDVGRLHNSRRNTRK